MSESAAEIDVKPIQGEVPRHLRSVFENHGLDKLQKLAIAGGSRVKIEPQEDDPYSITFKIELPGDTNIGKFRTDIRLVVAKNGKKEWGLPLTLKDIKANRHRVIDTTTIQGASDEVRKEREQRKEQAKIDAKTPPVLFDSALNLDNRGCTVRPTKLSEKRTALDIKFPSSNVTNLVLITNEHGEPDDWYIPSDLAEFEE